MSRTALIGICLAAFSRCPVETWAAPSRYVLEPGDAHVRFLAQSTLHDFDGETTTVHGEMTFDPEHDRLVAPARLSIPIAPIRTGIDARDRAMRRMFDAERFPELLVTIEAVSPLDVPSADHASMRRYHLVGHLRIRQVEQPIAFDAQATVTDEAVEASGQLPLTTTMFALKPPSVLGVIRVQKDIVVQFTSRWNRRP